tara:strand:- start:1026 stop:1475 length:450 start_codon:yes stop_codon:yes gene_type:complete
MHKRIGHEISKILESEREISLKQIGLQLIRIQKKYTENIYINIVINNIFPFSPPEVFINGDIYCSYLTNKNNNIKNIILKLNHYCPCCESILKNWSCSYFIVDIFDEIERNMKLYNTYLKMYYIKEYIVKKYPSIDSYVILELINNYLE